MAETDTFVPQTTTPGVRAVRLRSSHTFSKHSHDEFGIGLITNGAHRSASGHGTVEAHEGDIITVSPGEIHDGAPVERTPRCWVMLYVEPEAVMRFVGGEYLGAADELEFRRPVVRDRRLAARFRRAIDIVTTPSNEPTPLQADEVLGGLLDNQLRRNRSREVFPAHQVHRAVELINDDPTAHHTLDGLAKVAGLSRFQTVRAFERRIGLTPFAYIRQRRLDLARRMILRGVPLADAARGAGFSDQSHLTRTFKSAYAITPGALRRSRR